MQTLTTFLRNVKQKENVFLTKHLIILKIPESFLSHVKFKTLFMNLDGHNPQNIFVVLRPGEYTSYHIIN